MGCQPEGMLDPLPQGPLLNVFALVIYIPDPLGGFLDELRRKLVPGCNPHAHVSVLPPRPLPVPEDWPRAVEEARILAENWNPFRVEATSIQVFPATEVIYLEVGEGSDQFRRMHKAMNSRDLAFHEPFEYHPHITLAQEFERGQVRELRKRATELWSGYRGDRSFIADHAMFVRNLHGQRWIDLAEVGLGTVPVEQP